MTAIQFSFSYFNAHGFGYTGYREINVLIPYFMHSRIFTVFSLVYCSCLSSSAFNLAFSSLSVTHSAVRSSIFRTQSLIWPSKSFVSLLFPLINNESPRFLLKSRTRAFPEFSWHLIVQTLHVQNAGTVIARTLYIFSRLHFSFTSIAQQGHVFARIRKHLPLLHGTTNKR